MNAIRIKAIAKINIGLRILRKREDGFHDLHTLFYPIHDLFDEILIEEAPQNRIETNIPEINSSENLILQAVELYSRAANIQTHFEIKCVKNIPLGAGLGGGSSDAAHVLSALNAEFASILTKSQLNQIALKLGSDVPFFLDPNPSFGFSRGEVLAPADFPFTGSILLVNPGIHISTAEAFLNISPKDRELEYSSCVKNGTIDFTMMKEKIVNDFEEFVYSKYPEISEIKSVLEKCGAKFALMTGTGSTVFGLFENTESAESVRSAFPENYFKFISRVQ